ncbi:hypothetical protein [Bdellovibrio sp.]|uniref:hypothetical protein n=1 Tax=Bdellovibrio sp. TaxID=28201 RepID=UPI0039E420E1
MNVKSQSLKYLVILWAFALCGCQLDASIFSERSSIDFHPPQAMSYGKKVTTSYGTPGYQIQGVFFESGSQQKSNGYAIEGVFQ